METFLTSLKLPKVKEDENKLLTSEISEKEIRKAIAHLKPNKASGPDGFPAEWYKERKDHLIPKMKTIYIHVLKVGTIPPSWREAVVSLIPKEGKDKLDCGSYRPISVLNNNYKIFTYILAKRLEIILPHIISLDQTGFIRQRQTQDNIRWTLHLIEQVVKGKIPVVMLSLDAKKAFDRVNWLFLYKVLKNLGSIRLLLVLSKHCTAGQVLELK